MEKSKNWNTVLSLSAVQRWKKYYSMSLKEGRRINENNQFNFRQKLEKLYIMWPLLDKYEKKNAPTTSGKGDIYNNKK